MKQYVDKSRMQLIGRCTFNARRGTAKYESYDRYYTGSNRAILM